MPSRRPLEVIISLISESDVSPKFLEASRASLGGSGQVAERADVHLPQAVAATDRQLEVGDGGLQDAGQTLVVLLGLLVVVHVAAGAAVLEEEPGSRAGSGRS